MMAHKHLHELLKEDQEPFLLTNYIADRRSKLIKPTSKSSLQQKKRKPMVQIYKQACFSSLQDSPDVRKSPATAKTPCKSPNKSPKAVRLHIPATTAALLLDAAMKVHQKSSNSKPRKRQITNVGLGLLGSIIKRLSTKNRLRKGEIEGKSAGKSEKVKENLVGLDEISVVEMGFRCDCNYSRRCSTVWSESMDFESSSSSRSGESEEIDEFGDEERENGVFEFCDKRFCSSPSSPFRFALQNSPSPGCRTPVFSSPATSPSRHKKQEQEEEEEEENGETESNSKTHIAEEEEEEKEQCSPVSVLDPPFEDDDDGNGDEDSYDDLECSYAIVQRAKHQLLLKLRRFEKLAELDPIELEKRMLEELDDEDWNEEEKECEEADPLSLCREKKVDGFARDVPSHMKKLVLDLVAEEERGGDEREAAVKRVCERLDSWKEVQSNTIDMMVELDFRRGIDGWKGNDKDHVGEAAMEIEIAILGLLVEELSEDLVGV